MEAVESYIVESYIVALIAATRYPEGHDGDLAKWIEIGASPCGTLPLDRAPPTHAWLEGRGFVTPDDVQAVAHGCLRHRVTLSYAAGADGVRVDAWQWQRSDRPGACPGRGPGPAAALVARLQPAAAPAGAQHPDRPARLAAGV